MKQNLRMTTKAIAILTSFGLLTACGAVGATGTAKTSDSDADTAVGTEIQDLGTEEYIITEIDSAATDEAKQEKNILYLEEVLAKDIASAFPAVKDANVTLTKTEEDAAVTDVRQTMQADIYLDLEDELAEDSIVTIAEAVATAIDSETDRITIQDAGGKILYIRSEALPANDI